MNDYMLDLLKTEIIDAIELIGKIEKFGVMCDYVYAEHSTTYYPYVSGYKATIFSVIGLINVYFDVDKTKNCVIVTSVDKNGTIIFIGEYTQKLFLKVIEYYSVIPFGMNVSIFLEV